MRKWLFVVLACASCAKPIPVQKPEAATRVRPSWTDQVTQHVDAISACLERREAPRYVVFIEPLPSGAAGVTTIDAYEAVEHCAYLDGRIVRRQPVELGVRDIGEAGGVLLSLGPTQPVVPHGQVLEEVLERGKLIGWMFWPEASSPAASTTGEEATP